MAGTADFQFFEWHRKSLHRICVLRSDYGRQYRLINHDHSLLEMSEDLDKIR
jgi:hypothetical protein